MAEVDEEAVEEPTIEAPEDEVDPAPEVPDPAPESDTDEAAEDDSAAPDVIDDAVGGAPAADAGLDPAQDVAPRATPPLLAYMMKCNQTKRGPAPRR